MQIATTGLVLRQVKVGEADRILTILTPDLGAVSYTHLDVYKRQV